MGLPMPEIQQICTAHGLSLNAAAVRVKCDPSTLSRIVRGERRLTPEIADRLATALELHGDEAIGLLRLAGVEVERPPALIASRRLITPYLLDEIVWYRRRARASFKQLAAVYDVSARTIWDAFRAAGLSTDAVEGLTCERCGAAYTGPLESRHCSTRCADRARYLRAHPNLKQRPRVCVRCGKSFPGFALRQFCSKHCLFAAQYERRQGRKSHLRERQCPACGVTFVGHHNRRFCSPACQRKQAYQRNYATHQRSWAAHRARQKQAKAAA